MNKQEILNNIETLEELSRENKKLKIAIVVILIITIISSTIAAIMSYKVYTMSKVITEFTEKLHVEDAKKLYQGVKEKVLDKK